VTSTTTAETTQPSADSTCDAEQLEEESEPSPFDLSYVNLLNRKMITDLKEGIQNFPLQNIVLPDGSLSLLFQPVLSNLAELNKESTWRVASDLGKEIQILNSTLAFQSYFSDLINSHDDFTTVHVAGHVVLGAVRYVPSYLRNSVLGPEVRKEIDDLNSNLASRLHSNNSNVFYTVTTTTSNPEVAVAISPGLITAALAKQYVSLIQQTASEMEIHQKIEENIGEMVRKRIREAEEQIKKETQDISYQKSYIRRLPVVSSLWNWWAPLEDDQAKGRTFDIRLANLQESTLPRTKPKQPQQELEQETQQQPTDQDFNIEEQQDQQEQPQQPHQQPTHQDFNEGNGEKDNNIESIPNENGTTPRTDGDGDGDRASPTHDSLPEGVTLEKDETVQNE